MEKSELLLYRTSFNAQKQIFVFNSPIDYMDQELIVFHRPGGQVGDNGYCVVYRRDHYIITNAPNYQCPRKRFFLNACLRKLYFVNGIAQRLDWAPATTVQSRQEIWQHVDLCLRPDQISARRESLQHVKRQLFRNEETSKRRKQKQPVRSKLWSQELNFRSMRERIGRKQIPRGYLKVARRQAIDQLIRENIRREMVANNALCQNYLTAVDGIYNMNANLINDICNYHHNAAQHQQRVERRLTAGQARQRNNEASVLTQRAKRLEAMFIVEQVRRELQNHQVILEESVRSMFYAKELFRLVEDHEEFVYTDNQVLEKQQQQQQQQ